ncbi:CD276 antigen homolog [Hoplias malabaricus]|uniref:CD276 antigen homolog n=1 Tax=Hoplias malabaricus TaxID=27720 RepID=UPI003462432F
MVDKWDLPAFQFCLLLLLSGVSSYTQFEISVPDNGEVGVLDQSVILHCSFPVVGSLDMNSAVVTWQRGLEVVHSFYHRRDQLGHQNKMYKNRTSLYHEEMAKGNASLRLDQVTLEDAGIYTCSVSTQIGSQKKSFMLKVAAFYPEPHLHISLLSDGKVDLILTSNGGYPFPSLQWLVGNREDITDVTETQLKQDETTRLYSINSKLNLTRGTNSSITFILKNKDLGQEIRRTIDLFSESGKEETADKNRLHVVYMAPICILLIIGTAVITSSCLKSNSKRTPMCLECKKQPQTEISILQNENTSPDSEVDWTRKG